MLRILAATLVATTTLATTLSAQSLEQWGEAGGWDVMIDPTLGNGCLIQAEYDNGAVVRIGIDRNVDEGYITAFNEAWGDIEAGAIYPVSFELDGVAYDGEAKGIYLNGVPGADIYFDNEEFFFDIAQKYTMTLFNESGEVMTIDLGGTYAGLEAVLACQDEQG